ncbi:hypothetical protein CEUSTIGMA_g8890.t1 [Chlamydomonas eustigma]|uniref:alanine--glyoxylate transaminase n=1 Tax=Chlamydomonas eustigma TaxID=1157962 RepID=A0A250XEI7_9CHLO|nr:hypothetical protein CEUSTIGMA_g8890.t1 [Chlamydomonas eustigma]|eukprot:GAX81461.1 hypothetical protein CEUSTIGMA_g8890.t1 [Chlamydomonas eustigma]
MMLAAIYVTVMGIIFAKTMCHNLLMIPGPVEFTDTVLAAAGGQPMSHMDKSFAGQFGEAIELLRQVALTKTGQPFILAGSGSLGWDIFAANFIESGEHVLVINTGYFGDRFVDTFEAYNITVTQVHTTLPGTPPSLLDVESAIKAASVPFKAVTITHVDTSTGVLMDVKKVAALVRTLLPSALIVVDGVCSFGAESLFFDDWDVDFVLTASQKALGVPPGLCVVIASQRALSVLDARSTSVPSYYANLKKWLPIMRAYEAKTPAYFATPPVQLVQALQVSLLEILRGSDMAGRFAHHVEVSNYVKDKVESWGLKLVTTSREAEAHTLTAVYLPTGVTLPDLLPKVLKQGVMIGGGLHVNIAPKYFRIGHMHISSLNTSLGHIDTTLSAIQAALLETGYDVQKQMAEPEWVPRGKSSATGHDEL